MSESNYSVPNITDKYELTPEAYVEIFKMVNRRRRYCTNDFKTQSFFPDLD